MYVLICTSQKSILELVVLDPDVTVKYGPAGLFHAGHFIQDAFGIIPSYQVHWREC